MMRLFFVLLFSFILLFGFGQSQDSVKVSLQDLQRFRLKQIELRRCTELSKQYLLSNELLKDQMQLERNKFKLSERDRENLTRNIESLQLKNAQQKKRSRLIIASGALIGFALGVIIAK